MSSFLQIDHTADRLVCQHILCSAVYILNREFFQSFSFLDAAISRRINILQHFGVPPHACFINEHYCRRVPHFSIICLPHFTTNLSMESIILLNGFIFTICRKQLTITNVKVPVKPLKQAY